LSSVASRARLAGAAEPVVAADEWGGEMEDVVLTDAEDIGIELVEESAETEQYVYVWVRIRLI
jgi:hypothetical protein